LGRCQRSTNRSLGFFESPLQPETLVPQLLDASEDLFTSPSLTTQSTVSTIDDFSPPPTAEHQLELDRFDMALLAPEDNSLTSEQAYAAGEDFTLFG
jgi:hypothetical protein